MISPPACSLSQFLPLDPFPVTTLTVSSLLFHSLLNLHIHLHCCFCSFPHPWLPIALFSSVFCGVVLEVTKSPKISLPLRIYIMISFSNNGSKSGLVIYLPIFFLFENFCYNYFLCVCMWLRTWWSQGTSCKSWVSPSTSQLPRI